MTATMTLTDSEGVLADYEFGSDGFCIHGMAQPGPANQLSSTQEYWGLAGAVIFKSPRTTREITVDATFEEFASYLSYKGFINTLGEKVTMGGDLTVHGEGYTLCTFDGFFPSEPYFVDAITSKIVQRGVLKFTQILS